MLDSLLTWISEGTHGSTISMEDSHYDLEHMEVDGQIMDIDTGSRLELMEYSHGNVSSVSMDNTSTKNKVS